MVAVYKQTNTLPQSERFNICSQLQRAAISVTSNIAEGFSRRTYQDKISFLYISLGSAKEIQNLLLVCRDLDYFDDEVVKSLEQQAIGEMKLLMGLIKSFESRL